MARAIHRLAMILLCCMPVAAAHAQSPDDLDALRQRIDQLQQRAQFADALPLVEQLSEAVRAKFGEKSGEHSAILARYAGLLQATGRFADAEISYKRSLNIATAALGPEHIGVTFVLNDLAFLHKVQGRFAEAEPLYKRALSIREKVLGGEHPGVAHLINNLGALYVAQGRYAQAQPLFTRAIAINEKALKPGDPEVGRSINNLATLYWSIGRFTDAEPLYKRALAIVESALGSEHPAVSSAVNNLALVYQDQGRYAEAEPLLQRALSIREKAQGPEHPEVGMAANNLAWFYQARGRYSEAEPLYERALDISQKALGPKHADFGSLLNNLAVLYYDQGRYSEAETLFARAIDVRTGALGAEHSDVGQTMYRLARLYHAQKRFAEARPLHQRALEIRRNAQGPEHPEVVQSLNGIAQTWEAQGNWQQSVAAAREARDIVISRAQKGALGLGGGAQESGRLEIAQGRETFSQLVRSLWSLGQKQPRRRAELLGESYLGAHWAEQTDASAAVAQMSIRQARGQGTLATLIRERQDLVQEWQAADRQLYSSIAQSAGRNLETERQLHAQIVSMEGRLAAIDQTLKREFPDYFGLSHPDAVTVEETQKLLRHGEALVQFMVGESDVFIWTVTKTAIRWVRSPLGAKLLSERVAALRCGLDYTAWNDDRCPAALQREPKKETVGNRTVNVLPFDTMRAYELYAALLRPVEDLIQGKQLFVVPSGALSSLPFHVLVTKRPTAAIPSRLADYRRVPWLGVRQPVTVLPSVASLRALRGHAKASRAAKRYLGIGNPLLEGPQDDPNHGAFYKRQADAALARQTCASVNLRTQANRALGRGAVASFKLLMRSGRADARELIRHTPLPETADELCAVARQLGGSENAVLLGSAATERGLKERSAKGELAEYGILHFATHGILSGRVLGTAEPGLILTPPRASAAPKAMDDDDGYLSASEIATLKLNADWVVLSACNTAGPRGDTAEALSGLARAFFYAGTRALLVSHWEVDSEAAVKLTTRAFAEIAAKPSVSRGEALRISMSELLRKGSVANAHPSQWAPFVVVGEGRR